MNITDLSFDEIRAVGAGVSNQTLADIGNSALAFGSAAALFGAEPVAAGAFAVAATAYLFYGFAQSL